MTPTQARVSGVASNSAPGWACGRDPVAAVGLADKRDAAAEHQVARVQHLAARQVAKLSEGARDLLDQWRDAGWVHVG